MFQVLDPGRAPSKRAIINVVIPFRRRSSAKAGGESTIEVHPETAALERAAHGDQQAFADFYDLMSPLIFGIVLKVMRNRALAEEVTQEIFLELWRLAPRFDSNRGSAKAWAATIARRRAVDRVRSEEALKRREEREATFADVPADTVSEAIVGESERTMLLQAFDQLPELQQEAIGLAYFGGHSYRAVASMLSEPEGTVKTRIRDGLNRLRYLMEVEP